MGMLGTTTATLAVGAINRLKGEQEKPIGAYGPVQSQNHLGNIGEGSRKIRTTRRLIPLGKVLCVVITPDTAPATIGLKGHP